MRKHVGLKNGILRKRLRHMAAIGLCAVMLVSSFPGGVTAVSNAAETVDGSAAAQADEPTGGVETIKLTKNNVVVNFNPEGFKEIEGCVHDKVYYTAENYGAYAAGYYFLIRNSANKWAYKLSLPFTGDSLRLEYGLSKTQNGVKITTRYYSLLKINENGEPYVAEHDTIPDTTVTPAPGSDATGTPTVTEAPVTIQEQEITVKVASKKYTGNSIKKSKKTFDIGASAMTDISYKVTSGSKYVSVSGNGIVTVKKNTPAGKYKIRVTAKATDEYEEAETIVTVTVTEAIAPALKWSDFKTTGKYGFNFKKESKKYKYDTYYCWVSIIGEKAKDYKKLIKTKRGICLGSKQSDVIEAYGQPWYGVEKYKYKKDNFYQTIKNSNTKTANLLKKITKRAEYTANKFELDHPDRIASTSSVGDRFAISFYFDKNGKVALILFTRY